MARESITDRVRDLLVDVDYPANKDRLLDAARRRRPDEEALKALRAIPPVDYRNEAEVLSSIDRHPADSDMDIARDEPGRHREHTHRGLAQHMKDVQPSPIEEVLGRDEES